ncbi:MAG TPA: bifunctional uridylyltransferase/uridylyl-removing protein GlnD [Arsenophonus sp.]
MIKSNQPVPTIFALDKLSQEDFTLPLLKQQIELFQKWSEQSFKAGVSTTELIAARSKYLDKLLQCLWQINRFGDIHQLSLIAVGSYGRQELHPLSDIDLLILSHHPLATTITATIGQFITLLWDLGYQVGHSVRTLEQCLQAGQSDLSITTNLFESRLICGDRALFLTLQQAIFSQNFWPYEQFFAAKCSEQHQGHQRYHTSYNLEPYIKSSPGGLHDIDILLWLARRHFGATTIEQTVKFGFLTPAEYRELKICLNFLLRMRFALHLTIKRYDNRLLFEHQLNVTQLLGYKGENNQPVEQMMKDYYHVTRRIRELNNMLLQLFDEAIFSEKNLVEPLKLDYEFQLRGELIDLIDSTLFHRDLAAILRLFYQMVEHVNIQGIYSTTLCQLRFACQKLAKPLYEISIARENFITILRHPRPRAVKGAIVLMHLHDVLSACIPLWQDIVGQMQFDLFHTYTVDEHTVHVLQKIDQFADQKNDKQHPLCVAIYTKLAQPEILRLAAMFHDITKGRQGDHSELEAKEAEKFVLAHDLFEHDSSLVAWLVCRHLLMSVTAQRRDIQHPVVIEKFASEVKTINRLDYLLCLTVADICATNNILWNSWKQSLLKELYLLTKNQLNQGTQAIPTLRQRVQHNRLQVLTQLGEKNIHAADLKKLWSRCHTDYFLRHNPQQLAWHTSALLKHHLKQPLILISTGTVHGDTEIFIWWPDCPSLFAAIARELDRRNLNIHCAQILTNKDNMTMNTFIVLDLNGQPLAHDHYENIRQALLKVIKSSDSNTLKTRNAHHKFRHFNVPTKVHFLPNHNARRTYMELITRDKPELLAQIGNIFTEMAVSLHGARITTIGERVEDLFVLTDQNNQVLNQNIQQKLAERLTQALASTMKKKVNMINNHSIEDE